MTAMISEVYDALLAAGAPDDKARRAAEAIASYETRFAELGVRMDRLDGRMNTLTWMVGVNITLSLPALGKLLAFPLR